MCVLCGEFIMNIHWTDSKERSPNDDSTILVGDHQRYRKRNRLHRANLANKILKCYGLKLNDWNGSKFRLTSNKGKTEIIHDLGQLWPAVEKILGKQIDPLSEELVMQMDRVNHNG